MTDSTEVADASVKPRTWALIVWGLYLPSYVTFFLTYLVGPVIAYMERGDLAGTPFESHDAVRNQHILDQQASALPSSASSPHWLWLAMSSCSCWRSGTFIASSADWCAPPTANLY